MLRYRLASRAARDLNRMSPAAGNSPGPSTRHISTSAACHKRYRGKRENKKVFSKEELKQHAIEKRLAKKSAQVVQERRLEAEDDTTMTDLEYQRSLWEAQDTAGELASPKKGFVTPAQWLKSRKDVNSSSSLEDDHSSKKKDPFPRHTGEKDEDFWTRFQGLKSIEIKGPKPKTEAKSEAESEAKSDGKPEALEAFKPPNPHSREVLPNDTFNSMKPANIKRLRPARVKFQPVEEEDLEVPSLSYGLDRVLFNSGVYEIVDHRTQVFNFDPYLTKFMPVSDFDFDALKEYITSSKDTKLQEMARKHKRKYCGSTSSMTSILSQFHFLLSGFRKPSLSMLSKEFEPESYNFTRITSAPAAAYARLNDGVYAIDADKEYDTENVLAMLGKSMEKLLTLPREEFEKYRHSQSHRITEEERNADEVYHYTTLGDFLMRSQLDASDSRLPGTGVFDLKTRAVVSIRMDIKEYQSGMDYQIKTRLGQWESFEREYYDLIRSAFLKYSLQVRMGRMDGIFLAYHNTKRIFGFQYVSLEEMDKALHGTSDKRLGDQEFRASVTMLNDCLEKATKRFPGRTLRIHTEARSNKYPSLYFFAKPVSEEQVRATQEKDATLVIEQVKDQMKRQESMNTEPSEERVEGASKEVEDLQNVTSGQVEDAEMVPNEQDDADVEDDDASASAWEEIMSKVDAFVAEKSQGPSGIKEALQEALEEANMLYFANNDEMDEALDGIVAQLVADSASLREERATMQEEILDEQESVGVEESEESYVEQKKSAVDGIEPSPGAYGVPGEQEVKDKDLTVDETEISPGTQDAPETSGVSASDAELEAATSTEEPPQEQVDAHWTTQKETLKELFVKLVNDIDNSRAGKGLFEKALAKIAGQGSTQTTDAGSTPVDEQSAQKETSEWDSEATASEASEDRPSLEALSDSTELMGLVVTCRNRVNDKFVGRPEGPAKNGDDFSWSIEYNLSEMKPATAERVYEQLKARRRAAYSGDKDQTQASIEFRDAFRSMLREMSKKGKVWRKRLERKYRDQEVLVAWDEKPLPAKTRREGVNPPTFDE